jgi:hypothetical protein
MAQEVPYSVSLAGRTVKISRQNFVMGWIAFLGAGVFLATRGGGDKKGDKAQKK